MNNAECNSSAEAEKIASIELVEEMFDLHFHKAVVRAINNLKARSIEVSDYSVLDFLNQYGYPKTIQDQNEYNLLQANFSITYRSLVDYLNIIRHNKKAAVVMI